VCAGRRPGEGDLRPAPPNTRGHTRISYRENNIGSTESMLGEPPREIIRGNYSVLGRSGYLHTCRRKKPGAAVESLTTSPGQPAPLHLVGTKRRP
jgi:hypothetical protein